MKKFMQKMGMIIFWLSWPFWFLYFKVNFRRSRILVIANGEALVLKSWLGGGKWGLTGGGAERNESMEDCAVRELKEETGLDTAATAFRPLGKHLHQNNGLKFEAEFFVLELPERPELSIQRSEISDYKWIKLEEISGKQFNQDVLFAVEKYRPISQAELL